MLSRSLKRALSPRPPEHDRADDGIADETPRRELLHDLFSRSIRGAGRALTASQPLQEQQLNPLHRSQLPYSHRRQTSAASNTSAPAPTPAATTTASPPRPAQFTAPLLSSSLRFGSAVNANKPLPSPPPPGSKLDTSPPAKPVLKLARIMANLTADNIETLFSGAPQFFARSEGHFTGAPHPSTAFPWDDSLEIRDLTDHIRLEDAAWSSVTAWPHITQRAPDLANKEASASASETTATVAATTTKSALTSDPPPMKRRGHYYPRCRERPSMLSLQGLEKGTIGYEAALELAVSDALQEEQFGFDSVGTRPSAIQEARRRLMDPAAATAAAKSENSLLADESTSSVKFVGETQILEELIKNGRRYATGCYYSARQGQEFYDELFSHILHLPKKTKPTHHYTGAWGSGITGHLVSQIEALLDVLATPNVWIDFSHVEWRLRLGQILWTSSAPDELGDDTTRPQGDSTHDERYTERYWLLLQILLSTELLLRLDAITDGDEVGLEYVRPAEVQRFEKEANPSVRWSLILARAWLENMEVVRIDQDDATLEKKVSETPTMQRQPDIHSLIRSGTVNIASIPKNKTRELNLKHTIGWITTLTRKLSLAENRSHSTVEPQKKHIYAMKAKYVRRQQRGIAHFAHDLRWPDEVVTQLLQQRQETRQPLNDKVADPKAMSKVDKSMSSLVAGFVAPPTSKTKLEFNRKLPRRRKVVAGLHSHGWLSKSFLSGLVLPGDGACTLLMASLLEGDKEAMKELGSIAHLGAGFVYHKKSFWSTASVVGRVLAAGAGAVECMGWVSSDVLPQGLGNGWINVNVDDVLDDIHLVNRRARIWGKATVERESSVLGDGDSTSVMPADFVIPSEAIYKKPPPANTQVELQRFELAKNAQPDAPAPEKKEVKIETVLTDTAKVTTSQFAELAFAVSSDGEPEQMHTFALSYDIYFVTAHPCVVSPRVKVLKSPTSPTIHQVDVSGAGFAGLNGRIHPTSHLLHKHYSYASIHLTTLLQNRHKNLEELLTQYVVSTNRAARSHVARVLVIDCMTGFTPQPAASEMPMSPVMREMPSIDSVFPVLTREISPIAGLSPPLPNVASTAGAKVEKVEKEKPVSVSENAPAAVPSQMHQETRRRHFGSDMEIMVRALCAERGWNALISRRRRGCLACAVREAGALGWKVIVRVD